MTQYTSFVAVEKSRLTIDGKPVLVAVPIEMPAGVSYEGIFGGFIENAIVGEQIRAGLHNQGRVVAQLTESAIRDIDYEATSADSREQRSGERQRFINENLLRVRQFQLELKYDEALEVINEILLFDEHDPAVQALKEAINTTILYRKWDDDQRQRERDGQLPLKAQSSMSAPLANLTEVGGAVPTDWPNLSLKRSSPGAVAGEKLGLALGQIVELKHADPQAVAEEMNALLSPAGSRLDIQRRETGLVGFDIGGVTRTPPPGPPSATSIPRSTEGVQITGTPLVRTNLLNGRRARARGITDIDGNGAGVPTQPRKAGRGAASAPGAGSGGGFGGGGGVAGAYLVGDPSDEKKGKNKAEGTITFPWPQTPQRSEGRKDFYGLYSVGTDRAAELNGELPLISEIPLPEEFFRYKADDEKGLSSYEILTRDDQADKDTVDRRVAGKASLFDDLKKVAEANKVDNEPAETDAPASAIAPVDAGALAPAAESVDVLAAVELKDEAETSTKAIELPLLTHLFMRAGRPLLTNEIAILIGQLVEADQIDVAKQLTNELVIYLPDYEIGVKMHDAFANTELDDDSRSKAVIELALKAQAELEAIMFSAWAEARLHNVLEESLYEMLVDTSTDDTLLVSVLATSVDDEVLSALQQAGLIVKAKPTSGSFVVGETSTDRLIDLALLQAVRRIEPARLSPTPN
ncbi:MAG: hypothetical protein IIB53_04670 [Planctomycetes bacterium]|nr:hypothetical protein [Planctomycetota bacterium]